MRYGLAAGLFLLIFGSWALALPLNHEQVQWLTIGSGIAILLLLVGN